MREPCLCVDCGEVIPYDLELSANLNCIGGCGGDPVRVHVCVERVGQASGASWPTNHALDRWADDGASTLLIERAAEQHAYEERIRALLQGDRDRHDAYVAQLDGGRV